MDMIKITLVINLLKLILENFILIFLQINQDIIYSHKLKKFKLKLKTIFMIFLVGIKKIILSFRFYIIQEKN